jgi:hypothetical protein
MVGSPSEVLTKPRYHKQFDAVFLSARTAQCLDQPYFDELLKDQALIAVETAKFLVPLLKKSKEEYAKKIDEYAGKQGYKKINPGE